MDPILGIVILVIIVAIVARTKSKSKKQLIKQVPQKVYHLNDRMNPEECLIPTEECPRYRSSVHGDIAMIRRASHYQQFEAWGIDGSIAYEHNDPHVGHVMVLGRNTNHYRGSKSTR